MGVQSPSTLPTDVHDPLRTLLWTKSVSKDVLNDIFSLSKIDLD